MFSVTAETIAGKRIRRHRERTVGKKSPVFSAKRITRVLAGGSSRVFRKAFWASLFIRSASAITATFTGAEKGALDSFRSNSRVDSTVISFLPSARSNQKKSGWVLLKTCLQVGQP